MEDGRVFGRIEGLPGPWADGDTLADCQRRLREVLEEWLVITLRAADDVPVVGAVDLNFGGKRWSALSLGASSFAS